MEPVPILLEKLARLSDPELEASATRYARREHRNGAAVIAHIAEISRRSLHLKLGYKNLFEYVAERLGFQGGSAGLRIHVAKKARDCPRLLQALWNGELCLSGAALLVPHLSADNAERLIGGSAHKSTREIEELLRGVAPRPAYEPGIRRAAAPAPAQELPGVPEPERRAESTVTGPLEALPGPVGEMVLPQDAEPPARDVPELASVRRTSNVLQPATPETYNFRFSASKGFRDKLERLAEVLGVEDPVRQMGEILEKAVDCLLERKDPRARRARRLQREERRRAHRAPDVRTTTSEAAEPPPAAGASAPSTEREAVAKPEPRAADRSSRAGTGTNRGRRPSAADWDDALERAGHRCEYVGRDGRRCTARAGLQPDHYPVPWSVSRSSEPEGIRVHCPAHNSLTAREYFGEEFIHDKVAGARASRQASRREAAGQGRKVVRGGTGKG